MQVADWLHEHLGARGVGVVIEAEHSCMTLRGVQAVGSSTVTSALLGTLRSDPARARSSSPSRASGRREGEGLTVATGAREPAAAARRNGYAALRAYAPIGDGRSVALVSDDGSIDWLAWPDLDSPSVFAALLDAGTGGSCVVAPTVPFTVSRRYLPATNVLETTFLTQVRGRAGAGRPDPPGPGLGPSREVQRRVEGVSGAVPMQWAVRPRFGYGQRPTRLGWRVGRARGHLWQRRAGGLLVRRRHAGHRRRRHPWQLLDQRWLQRRGGPLRRAPGAAGVPHPRRSWTDDSTARSRAGARGRTPFPAKGRGGTAVLRSALALKLLVYAPSGALAAAATTSLPEEIGGERNWDYRFCWVRDAAFTLDALLRLGCAPEARGVLLVADAGLPAHPPAAAALYRLDGGARARERSLALDGYRGSQPGAGRQRRGRPAAARHLRRAAADRWLYAEAGGRIDRDIGRRLAEIADLVCRLWRQPGRRDLGGAQRAAALHPLEDDVLGRARPGLPAGRPRADPRPARRALAWRRQPRCRDFVETALLLRVGRGATRASAGSDELDASAPARPAVGLRRRRVATRLGQHRRRGRAASSGTARYVRRYTGEDGLAGAEGAFVSCSFWLAEALARTGRRRRGRALMDELVALANDVGLYAEEIDPAVGRVPRATSRRP